MQGQNFTRIFPSLLTFSTPAEESAFSQYVIRQVEHTRKLMGWEHDKEYRKDSFLWRLDRDQRKYEQDYEFRKTCGEAIFEESNIALNPVLKQINQHSDKLSNDLLSGPQFFTVKPQGNEDSALAGEALEFFKERLFAVSKRINLHKVGRDAAKGAFIRGQETTIATYCNNGYLRPVRKKVLKLDGKVIKDSTGVPVTDDQVWITNPANPDEFILDREIEVSGKIRISAQDYSRVEEGNDFVSMEYIQDDRGADAKVVYYGDFFWSLTAPSIGESPIKGHAFRAEPSSLVMSYPPEERLPEANEYLKYCVQNGADNGQTDYVVQAGVTRTRDGEDEYTNDLATESMSDPRGYRSRAYYYVIIRYDANYDGIPEDIYCIVDVKAQKLIHYEYAAIMFPWVSGPNPHPYQMHRIWPKLGRATGTGFYALLEAWETLADKMINRFEIDAATSGNVVFENRQATEQGIDGTGIQFRTRMAYDLRPGFTSEDAFQVKTVAPANGQEFLTLMEKFTAQIELTGGSSAPQDATTADMPGSDTLGVANILKNSADQSLRARESEIIDGLTDMLHAIADIEAWSIKQAAAEGDLGWLAEQLGEEKAMMLADWLKQIGDKYRDSIEVNLSKSSSMERVEQGNSILNVLSQWMNVPSPWRDMLKNAYLQILGGLDVSDPEATLNIEGAKQADAMMAEMMAAQQPQPKA